MVTATFSWETLPSLCLMLISIQFCTGAEHRIGHCICEMHDVGLVLYCQGSNITEVPHSTISHKVSVLYLQYNRIERIRSGDFVQYANLSELYLKGNRISTIEDKAFDSLERLRVFDMSQNLIKIISETQLEKLRHSLKWISLAMNALTQMPTFRNFDNLKHINVSNNRFITELPPDAFPSGLKELDLHYTAVKNFRKESFQNLHNLTSLRLHDNLASSSVTFEEGIFDNLSSLEFMDLSRTFCKRLLSSSFIQLTRLKTLLLNNCWLSNPPYIRNPFLEALDLSNNRRMKIKSDQIQFPQTLVHLRLARIVLSEIDENMFRNLTKVKTLDICGSKVKNIDENTFGALDTVSELCLSRNPFETVPRFPRSLKSINITDTKIKSLDRDVLGELQNVIDANFQRNQIEHIDEYAFGNMLSMHSLDLSNNNLRGIRENTFSIGSYLQHKTNSLIVKEIQSVMRVMNLSFNSISEVESGAFLPHSRLEILDLKSNDLSSIQRETFAGLKSLKQLELNLNDIKGIGIHAFKDMAKLKILNLEDNDLEVLQARVFAGLVSLEVLRLGRNDLLRVPVVSFPSLRYLDLSYNKLKDFPLLGGKALTTIKASHNSIKNLTANLLRLATNAVYIDLSNCKISEIEPKAFQCTSTLQELDLSKNRLSTFITEPLSCLEKLSLAENLLISIHSKISDVFPKIQSLNLSFNHITSINPSVFNSSTSLSSLELSGNYFYCDCALHPLTEWLVENSQIVKDPFFNLCDKPDDLYAVPIIDAVSDLDCGKSGKRKGRRNASRRRCSCAELD